jgi:hypothetical protein
LLYHMGVTRRMLEVFQVFLSGAGKHKGENHSVSVAYLE